MTKLTLRDTLISEGVLVPVDELAPSVRSDVPRLDLDEAARRAIKSGKTIAMESFLVEIERNRDGFRP